jgi:hypothetical protein
MDEEYCRWIHNSETTVNDARKEGYRAYQDSLMPHDNPYNNNEEWDLRYAWIEGWLEAGWDD